MKEVRIGEFLDSSQQIQNGGIIANSLVIHYVRFQETGANNYHRYAIETSKPFYYPLPLKDNEIATKIDGYSINKGKMMEVTILNVDLESGVLQVKERIE